LLEALFGDGSGLCHGGIDRLRATLSASQRNRTERAGVVASVLHLKEGSRPIGGGVGRSVFEDVVDARDGGLRLLALRELVDQLEEPELLRGAEDQIHAFDTGNLPGL